MKRWKGKSGIQNFGKKNKKGLSSKIQTDSIHRNSALLQLNEESVTQFSNFLLSDATLKGLRQYSFVKPTLVQRLSLKHALLGKDIIVEAKTGSGKTLAFAIPVLEYVYHEKITQFDGPVAVVLTPTRELARQIYNVFRRVGRFHNFTILDIMGGKTRTDKREEWQRIAKSNILIGTPGRFAQHQLENPTLDLSNLRILVLDEADRLMDPTFRHDLQSIVDNLNADRQCLLYSATLVKSPDQLEFLNLKSPIMISTNSAVAPVTPAHLIQFYSIVPLERKLDVLWAFLQSHCKKKIIVFFSTQKQVRFVHDLLLQIRPFFSVMQLRGNMLQSKRFKIYEKFSQTPRGAVLLATNIAERGLDFPEVHWVVQYDCPKQLDDYIHRVGRTARAERIGRAITFLLPSETKLVDLLAQRNVTLKQQQIPESRIKPVLSNRAPLLLASQPELATSARSAFTAYLRDYCFTRKQSNASNKTPDMSLVFQPAELPIAKFAASLGLAVTPEIPKILQQRLVEVGVTAPSRPTEGAMDIRSSALWSFAAAAEGEPEEEDDNDGLLKRKAFSALEANPGLKAKLESRGGKLLEVVSSEEEEEDDDDIRDIIKEEGTVSPQRTVSDTMVKHVKQPLTRVQLAKRELKKNIRSHSKIQFDESGNPLLKTVGGVPVPDLPKAATDGTEQEEVEEPAEVLPVSRLNVESARRQLKTIVDAQDKARWRERVRQKHRLERQKAKEARKTQQAQQISATKPTLGSSASQSDQLEYEDTSESDYEASDAEIAPSPSPPPSKKARKR
uniref:ATP-dependent RNA helicase n=1 Tax=Schistocephalus solidus TaxID=70667 RepID=A0A0X3NXQ6_SCHSO